MQLTSPEPDGAFLQVGNDEIFDEFQSGWSGAPYTPEIPFSDDSKAKAMIIGLTGKPEAVKKKKKKKGDNVKKFTQLDAMVQYAAKLAEENGWFLVQDTAWPGYEDVPTWIVQGYTTMLFEAPGPAPGQRL